MNITTSLDAARNLTFFFPHGPLALGDLFSVLRVFYTQRPTANALWNFEDVAGEGLREEELRILMGFVNQYAGNRRTGKTALVVPETSSAMLRRRIEFYGATAKLPWEVAVFTTVAEALGWIERS